MGGGVIAENEGAVNTRHVVEAAREETVSELCQAKMRVEGKWSASESGYACGWKEEDVEHPIAKLETRLLGRFKVSVRR